MDKKEKIKEILHELLTSQRLAVLGTHNEGQPYGSLVAFAVTNDLKQLLFATSRATRKFANITADARVSMLVDSRSNRVADFRKAVAVTAIGTAREARGKEKKKFLTIYLARHPRLKEFVCTPSCALLKIRVETYYLVCRFQEVLELKVG